jgi:hypothetical protein
MTFTALEEAEIIPGKGSDTRINEQGGGLIPILKLISIMYRAQGARGALGYRHRRCLWRGPVVCGGGGGGGTVDVPGAAGAFRSGI